MNKEITEFLLDKYAEAKGHSRHLVVAEPTDENPFAVTIDHKFMRKLPYPVAKRNYNLAMKILLKEKHLPKGYGPSDLHFAMIHATVDQKATAYYNCMKGE